MPHLSVGGRVWALLLPLVALSLMLTSVSIMAAPSIPEGQFSIAPSAISLGWSNSFSSNVTITNAASYITRAVVHNYTTGISANYSQKGLYPNTSHFKYWWQGSVAGCFAVTPGYDSPLLVRDANNPSNYTNITGNISSSANENLTLISVVTCPPGRYWGYFNVTNATNISEYLEINTTLNVPISTNNQLTNSSGIALVYGEFPALLLLLCYVHSVTVHMTGGTDGVEVSE